MKSFKEFIGEEGIEEGASMQTRMKMRAAFRRNKAKILFKRKKAMKKPILNPKKVAKKANKAARNLLIRKILKGRSKSDLSMGAKKELEKRLEKKKSAIQRIAKKVIPKVRAKEMMKTKKKKDA